MSHSAPLLSVNEAHLVALTLTSTYVGGLYVSRLSLLGRNKPVRIDKRPKDNATPLPDLVEDDITALDRDDPKVIKKRIGAVTLATLGAGAVVAGIVYARGGAQEWRELTNRTSNLLGLPALVSTASISIPKPSFSTIWTLLPSYSNLFTIFKNIPVDTSTMTLAALRPLLPYSLAPALFFGPIVSGYYDETWPGQRKARGVFARDGLFECLALLVPTPVKNLGNYLLRVFGSNQQVTIEENDRDTEQRRWIEMRNYIAGPLSEELVFRSALIAVYGLAGASWKVLTFGTPLWFGLAHVHHAYELWKKERKTVEGAITAGLTATFQFTYTTLFGWFAAYLFVRTGSIFPPIASHVFCNIMGFPNVVQSIEDHPDRRAAILSAYAAGMGAFAYGIRQL